MPTNNRTRGCRGKRKQKPPHTPARPLQEEINRLQQAVDKSTKLNHIASLSSQAEGSAHSSSAAALPADAGEAYRGSDSELLQDTTPPGVVHVSVESDSDNISIPSDSEGVDTANTPTTTYPTPYHKVEKSIAPDGRTITKITVLPTSATTEHTETTTQSTNNI